MLDDVESCMWENAHALHEFSSNLSHGTFFYPQTPEVAIVFKSFGMTPAATAAKRVSQMRGS